MSATARSPFLQAHAAPAGPGAVGSTALAAILADRWIVPIFALNLAHVYVYSRLYPEHRLDADLLAYFTFFRNWLSGDSTLHSLAYYSAPKALLVFTIGMLGNATAALACTAIASAVLGTVVYVIARDSFGLPAALATSVFLLFDPSKAFLTLKSSADLYLALLLFLAVLLANRDRLFAAAACLFLSVLVKPVTLPCAAYFLTVSGNRTRRWLATIIPFGAVPLVLLVNHALLGGALGGARFFDEFATMADMPPLGPTEVVHYALWSQLVKIRFVATASWGLLGMLMWVRSDRSRLIGPLFLMPLLFLCGYVLLSATAPFPPYFRYFWPLEIWFLLFLVFGIFEGARRLAGTDRWLRRAIIAMVLLLLADASIGRQLDYRHDYALPIERAMRFAEIARGTLRAQELPAETVVAPLSLLPYMTWHFPDAVRAHTFDTAERVTRERLMVNPDWIVDIPGMYKTDATRQWIQTLVQNGGYEVSASDGESALLRRAGLRRLDAARSTQ